MHSARWSSGSRQSRVSCCRPRRSGWISMRTRGVADPGLRLCRSYGTIRQIMKLKVDDNFDLRVSANWESGSGYVGIKYRQKWGHFWGHQQATRQEYALINKEVRWNLGGPTHHQPLPGTSADCRGWPLKWLENRHLVRNPGSGNVQETGLTDAKNSRSRRAGRSTGASLPLRRPLSTQKPKHGRTQ